MSDVREQVRDTVRGEVRDHYRQAAEKVLAGDPDGCGCGDGCCSPVDADAVSFYDVVQKAELPDAAVMASLGCGNPTAVAELREGETVLDLGSGGGIDVLLSARRIGPTGRAYGLDMTDEMLELARSNAAESGLDNVEFLKGYMEEIPLPNASVDVVISNCVVNLSIDKERVFAEMARVLRPGGRIGIADVVASDSLAPELRAERGSYAGCIAGALSFAEYGDGLLRSGFEDVTIEPTHEVVEDMFGAIVRARRPLDERSASSEPAAAAGA